MKGKIKKNNLNISQILMCFCDFDDKNSPEFVYQQQQNFHKTLTASFLFWNVLL